MSMMDMTLDEIIKPIKSEKKDETKKSKKSRKKKEKKEKKKSEKKIPEKLSDLPISSPILPIQTVVTVTPTATMSIVPPLVLPCDKAAVQTYEFMRKNAPMSLLYRVHSRIPRQVQHLFQQPQQQQHEQSPSPPPQESHQHHQIHSQFALFDSCKCTTIQSHNEHISELLSGMNERQKTLFVCVMKRFV